MADKTWQDLAREYTSYHSYNGYAIHITASDRPDYKYMAWVYDRKRYVWINADIYADTPEDVSGIADMVYYARDTDMPTVEDLHITIDYGDEDDRTTTVTYADGSQKTYGSDTPIIF